MQLKDKRVLLTGAAGGMGQLIAEELAKHGARLILTDLNAEQLNALTVRLGDGHVAVVANLCDADGRARVFEASANGGVDMLINAAGMSEFALATEQSAQRIELMMQLNLVAPMLLSQALLPLLSAGPEAAIVNIGSTFGAIGYPGFTAYCASKAGLRGYTEALRRELADTSIDVFYIAPRATKTDMNSAAVVELNETLGNAMDTPELVVQEILRLATTKPAGAYFLGWPEKLFVRVNALLPTVVDGALRKHLATIKRLAAS